jgi:hypothetical protein
MKIIFAKGQTCNQFWIYTNFIAEALENKEQIAFWLPDITINSFPHLYDSILIKYPLYSKRLSKLIGYKFYIKSVSTIFCNKYFIKLLKIFFKVFPVHEFIVADVFTKKSSFRVKYLEQIKRIFTPEINILNEVNYFLKSIKGENQILIGVHIRYGDYRQFENGKYFYSVAQYKIVLDRIAEIFKSRDVVFFVACSEAVSLKEFAAINYKVLPNTSAMKDLYCLSKADFIVGPPSTFSAWASLYGDIPIYFIENIVKQFDIVDFTPIQKVWF